MQVMPAAAEKSTKYPTVKIKNSTQSDLEIFDIFNKSGKKTDPYTYTSLGIIPAGKTAKIKTIRLASQLQAMCSGTIADIGQEEINFPISVMEVTVFSKQTSFTIETSSIKAMVQTYNFIRYVTANPSSKLATQFLAALGSDKDQKTAVDTFFSQSKSFNFCSLSSWAAIMNWQEQFLSAWQGSFYLYDASDGQTDIKLVAGVNISISKGKTQAVLCMADSNGKWSKASQQTPIIMSGGTITEETPGQGGISLSLTPIWMNVTQKNNDQIEYLIGPTLSGIVNNKKVLGNFQQLTTSSNTKGSGTKQTSISIWAEIKQNAGLLISAGMLYIMYKQWKESKESKSNDVINKSKDPEADKAKIEKEQKNVEEQIDKSMQEDMSVKVKNVSSEVSKLPKQEQEVRDAEKTLDVQNTLDSQKEELGDILQEAPPSQEVENIADNMGKAQSDLDAGKPDDALEKLDEVGKDLNTVVKNNQDEFSKEQIEAADKVTEDIQKTQEEQAEIDKAEAEKNAEAEKGPDSDFGDDGFESVKTDPIDFAGGE